MNIPARRRAGWLGVQGHDRSRLMCGRPGPVSRTLFLWTMMTIPLMASVGTISRVVQVGGYCSRYSFRRLRNAACAQLMAKQ